MAGCDAACLITDPPTTGNPRRQPQLRRRRIVAGQATGLLAGVVVAAALVMIPATASAHLRSGTVAVDYRAAVLTPDTPAYFARIYQSDRGLNLTVKPGHVVIALGYLGEPMFRLDPAGLWVNAASPTAVVGGLVTKAERVNASTPRWRLKRGRDAAVWHDARVQGLPSGVDRGVWSVPLVVDGRRLHLAGYLIRFPKPKLWLWVGILAGLLGAGVWPMRSRRNRLVQAGAIGCALAAAAASILIALAFALDTYASPGTWVEGLDEIAFVAVGVGVLLWGPRNLHVGAAIGSGLVAVAVGLSKGAVFLHPIVLAILPGTAVRVLVIAALAAGLAAAALGCMFYVDLERSVRRP
jgi:hypothetical protein